MKTEKITVTADEAKITEALNATEGMGKSAGLDGKSILHLRLLSEELFGMLRGIAGEVESKYWIEAEDKSFKLNMSSQIALTDEMRKQFISASTSGKNSAATSFMGKIRVMIANMMFSAEEAIPYAMINTAAAYTAGSTYEDAVYVWTMTSYKDEVKKNIKDSKDASEAWDQLEKSIVANIADDIKVSIAGKNVQITVFKKF